MEAAVYAKMAEVEREHWWFAARRQIIATVIGGLRLPRDARILEIGCGTGGNLEMLSGFGHVVAVEMAAQARALTRRRWSGPLIEGWLPDGLQELDGEYDLVVMLDILEHIEADADSLATVARLLRPRGHLVITVPAFPILWSQHDVAHHHYRRYRRGPLAQLVKNAGLTILQASYFNTVLFPLIAASRLLERCAGSSATSDVLSLPSASLNRVLQFVFANERHFIPWAALPFGVSLLTVAQRRP